jgi:hypothetical protein
LIELVQLGAQQSLVRQQGLILGDQCRRGRAAEGILDYFGVFGGAEEHADGGTFMGLAHVAVEGFEVELQLAEVLGLELVHFQFDGDQTVQTAMEEQEIEREVPPADLDGVLRTDKAESRPNSVMKRPRWRSNPAWRSASE